MDQDEKICPRCAETVKSGALVCKHCQYVFGTPVIGPVLPSAPLGVEGKKRRPLLIGCAWLFGGFLLIGIIGNMLGLSGDEQTAGETKTPTNSESVRVAAIPDTTEPKTPKEPAAVSGTYTFIEECEKSCEEHSDVPRFESINIKANSIVLNINCSDVTGKYLCAMKMGSSTLEITSKDEKSIVSDHFTVGGKNVDTAKEALRISHNSWKANDGGFGIVHVRYSIIIENGVPVRMNVDTGVFAPDLPLEQDSQGHFTKGTLCESILAENPSASLDNVACNPPLSPAYFLTIKQP